ncbi:cadherin-like beta sandwich domain-containing protein [Paenibacillus sp. FSL H8-0261]|uniref:cadherin-like beta sandwich domain-containing protein n=1 Tax=Paenibacillus sp. FSL H8-0261 TaxID=2921381 RepID=UPI003250408A
MLITKISGSTERWLKGFTIRLLVGLMIFSSFSFLFTGVVSAQDGNTGPDGSPGWTYCADEGEDNTCIVPGRKEVRYWATGGNYKYYSKIITDSTICSNDVMGGDPEGGIRKQCYYRDLQLDSGEMTKVVSEQNKTLTVTFNVYARQAGTIEDLREKITVKKTSGGAYAPLDVEDTVTNVTYTDTSSTLEIHFKDTLVGDSNVLKIDAGAFVDSSDIAYSHLIEIANIQFTPPLLTADTDNNYTDKDITITFPDDSLWREAINAVSDGGAVLSKETQYAVDAGMLTIKAGVLMTKGSHDIRVTALGYPDVVVSQQMIKKYTGNGSGTESEPYLIENADQLSEVRNHMESGTYFKLIADIDLKSYASWTPIGNDSERFKGSIDGNGYKIKNLIIQNNYTSYLGLFGFIDTGSKVTSMRLENVNITGSNFIGAIAGANDGTIDNSYVTGVSINGSGYIGGMVGYSTNGSITNSYAIGSVNGYYYAGGLVGYAFLGTVSDSYASGSVTVNNIYGINGVGGLIGYSYFVNISNSYATGTVKPGPGTTEVGGLIGSYYYYFGSLANSFYDKDTAQQEDTGKGEGKTTAEMHTKANFSGWNFDSTWYITPDQYPKLWAFTDLSPGTKGWTTKINHVSNGMEYSLNDSDYIPITNIDADNIVVDAGDQINVRVAGDITSSKTLTVGVADIKAGPTLGSLTVGTTAGTTKLINVSGDMEYRVNSGSYEEITDTSEDNISAYAGDTIFVRLAATSSEPASFDQKLKVNLAHIKSATAPTGLLGPGTIGGTTKLRDVSEKMEYKINENPYKGISGTSVDNLIVNENDTISVRIAETAKLPSSEVQELTVESDVINPKSADATLSGLTFSDVTLSPTFSKDTLTYTAAVANSVTNTTITTTKGNKDSVILVTDLGSKSLSVGVNTFIVHVTAEDGVTKKEYTVTVTRATSSDASLSALTLNGVTLSPVFASGTLSYTANVANNVTSTTIGASTNSGAAMVPVADLGLKLLSVGANTFTVHVTAEDGITKKDYTVKVTRAKSSDATLRALTLSGVWLSPVFASGTLTYTANVANDVTSTTVGATKNDGTATVSAGDLGSKTLSVGSNIFTVHVTAEDGTKKDYTVTVTRAASSDATLRDLTLSGVRLSPAFASGTLTYTANVANDVTSTTVGATKNDGTATVSVGDLGSKSLSVGKNIITVNVIAEDGSTKKKYTVEVTRAASSDATLSDLSLSGVTLSPTFDEDTLTYVSSVTNDVKSTIVAAATNDEAATISADDLGSKSLSVGKNIITVTVTAEDGSTKKEYTVEVTRAASSDATLSDLSLSGVTLSPTFTSGTLAYTANVANDVKSTTVSAAANDETATISADDLGSKSLSVGKNIITVNVTAEDGSTKKEYIVEVTRAASSDATLSDLSLSGVTLSPTFTSGTLAYSANVANDVKSTTVSATKNDGTATISADDLGSKSLSVGKNTLTVNVTAEDGITKKEYTVTVTRAAEEVISGGGSGGSGGGLPTPTLAPTATLTPVATPMPTVAPATTPGSTPTPANNLSDISGHWAQRSIQEALSLGIIKGYSDGTFKPNGTLTRAEFALMLMNALKPQETGTKLTFTDAAKIGAWAQEAVAQAVQAGIINGYEDGTFRPNTEITRAEMAVILAKILGKSNEASATTGFADDKDIPEWAKSSVAYLKLAGLVKGKGDNEFAPQDHATRGEAITILLNLLKQINK